jgi:hypothetical protein
MYTSLDLTKFSKNQNVDKELDDLTKISKVDINNHRDDDLLDVKKNMI